MLVDHTRESDAYWQPTHRGGHICVLIEPPATACAFAHPPSLTTCLVQQMFDLKKMYEAALIVTERSCGKQPHPRQEVYGRHNFDVLWVSGGMAGGAGFDLAEVLGHEKRMRITTFTDQSMFRLALSSHFGEHAWDKDVLTQMHVTMHEDLNVGHKVGWLLPALAHCDHGISLQWQYQTADGICDLYERSGGTHFLEEMQMAVRPHTHARTHAHARTQCSPE